MNCLHLGEADRQVLKWGPDPKLAKMTHRRWGKGFLFVEFSDLARNCPWIKIGILGEKVSGSRAKNLMDDLVHHAYVVACVFSSMMQPNADHTWFFFAGILIKGLLGDYVGEREREEKKQVTVFASQGTAIPFKPETLQVAIRLSCLTSGRKPSGSMS